jgi:hypothetical protein
MENFKYSPSRSTHYTPPKAVSGMGTIYVYSFEHFCNLKNKELEGSGIEPYSALENEKLNSDNETNERRN